MKFKDLKTENYLLPDITYDKYGMPNYKPYMEIISKGVSKGLTKVQIQRFLENKLEISAKLSRELLHRWEKVNRQKIPRK